MVSQIISELSVRKNYKILSILIVSLTAFFSSVIILLMRRLTLTIQIFASTLMQRTKELNQEKEKSNQLLNEILPDSVAKQLKENISGTVIAETFDEVTVYFSDIVSFTEIAARSTPMQVITFLNELYKVFDSRLQEYDVYKVETIGDSYMVASGIPVKNGHRHAREIADMALKLLEDTANFKIPHNKEPIHIRIGIHTGPCVAGVVGTKMPRYCLFGDTINTASRMESTGERNRIQISADTKRCLDFFGGYIIEFRSVMEVKGKGSMETYWLMGKIVDQTLSTPVCYL